MQRIACALGATDPTKATELANGLPSGSAQNDFLIGMARGMAINSPREAATFVSQMSAGDAQTSAADAVVAAWSRTDPEAAADWVLTFPAGKDRTKNLDCVISSWASDDPRAVDKWLTTLPADQSQRAIQDYVYQMAIHYPDLAAPWVEKINNPRNRNKKIEKIARSWRTVDPGAAQAWLANTSLPDDRKQQLLKNWMNP